MLFVWFGLLRETKLHYEVLNSLETFLQLSLASISGFSCFCPRRAGIIGINHTTSGLGAYCFC